MSDRLESITRILSEAGQLERPDLDWLISEVERLRGEITRVHDADIPIDKLLSGEMVAITRETFDVLGSLVADQTTHCNERDFAQEALDKIRERLARNAGKVASDGQ